MAVVASPSTPLLAKRSQESGPNLTAIASCPSAFKRGAHSLQSSSIRTISTVKLPPSQTIHRKLATPVVAMAAHESAVGETEKGSAAGLATLTAFVNQECRRRGQADLASVFAQLQTATRLIASRISRLGIENLSGLYEEGAAASADRDKQKKLDVVANDILKGALQSSGLVAVLASEEDDEPIAVEQDGKYVVVFDPLDGSRNIDASIPTGTIFGIYKAKGNGASAAENALQAGKDLIAAGYSLYSSATMMVISLGNGTHGFTLDSSIGEFVLTHPNMQVPKRGQIYSLNDARYFDWPAGLQKYIDTVRQGKGQNPKKYSARYICSLVADLHRTILYGGWAGNPRGHLRLVYEANPLGFLVEQAGGKASDGKRRILDIQVDALHQRLPLFLGSADDITELESYGDVQQLENPGYEV